MNPLAHPTMLLRRYYDDTLAQASYLIACQATGEALVVDPLRDAERTPRPPAGRKKVPVSGP